MNLAETALYRAGAAMKTAYYAAHYLYARRVSGPFDRPGAAPFRSSAPAPDAARLRAAFLDVFAQDEANIAAGLYPAPAVERELARTRAARAYRADVRAVDARRLDDRPTEARDLPGSKAYPLYYRQNFHWQTDGWLTDASASIYDFQVETIFTGSAAAMRRATALALLAESLVGRDQRGVRTLDLAAGAGAFSVEIARTFPRMDLTALDLSAPYAARAARALRRFGRARAVQGLAEALPFADESLDRVVSVYLFHELPPKIRRAVVAEVARVLKPGGVFILADALQRADDPNLDRLLEAFPAGFHEPYFTSWLDLDMDALADERGLTPVARRRAFLTKATAWRKSGPASGAAQGV